MTDQIENIELKIDETKASLADKLEALETQVVDAVQATTETVSDTVGAVKQTVETVKEKVRDAGQFFDLRRQAERNPWAVFGCSVAAGCLATYFLSGSAKGSDSRRRERDSEERRQPEALSVAPEPATTEPKEPKHSWLREQLSGLSGLAVGALMGVVRDVAASNLPDGFGQSISQEIDRVTTKLGGKPISGPVASTPKQPVASTPKQPAV